MRTVIAIQEKKMGFVAGLKWQELVDYKGRGRVTNDVRAKAQLAMADKIVIHSVDSGAGVQTQLGMYAQNDFDQVTATQLHSLAAAFVLAFPKNLHQILLWKIDDKRFCVIIVQNGLPIADEIKSDVEATKLMRDAMAGRMGNTGHVHYTNDDRRQFGAELVDESIFIAKASKATRLQSVPIRPLYLLAGAVILAVAAASAFAVHTNIKKKERAELAARKAAQDPVPGYLQALGERISKLGLERKSLKAVLNSIGGAEVWNEGWTLVQIECAAGYCISSWDRKGGTTAALVRANPHDELLSSSTSEKSNLRRTVPLKEAGLPDRESAVPMEKALADYVNTYQVWRNAGLVVTESQDAKDFVVWPDPPSGDKARLPKELAMRARPISVSVPYPLADELIDSTPQGVWWESFVLQYSANDGSLTVHLKGKTYVK